jgi:uncharacterized protein (TIGR03083 family)
MTEQRTRLSRRPTTVLRHPAIDRQTAMRLATTEYNRFAALLEGLTASQWTQPTDCAAWDVRAMACHVLGMAEFAASIREGRRQRRAAMRRGGVWIDALNDLQVRERTALTPAQITRRFRRAGPRAVRGRRRTPALIRRRRMPIAQQVGDAPESWAIGYVTDVILTRDVWMHRIDIARATGRPMHLTADHDGVLVADVVAEWASRHQEPYTLSLTGPAGGAWSAGTGGPTLEFDAVEFCRALSGRGHADGLLAVAVPF